MIKYTFTARLVPEALLMLTIRTRHQAGGVRLIVAHPLERLLLSAGKVSKFSKVLNIVTSHCKYTRAMTILKSPLYSDFIL